MKKILTEEASKAILDLLKEKRLTILIIEDNKVMRETLEMCFADTFPNATVYCFKGFNLDENPLETLIKNQQQDIIVTGGSLNLWDPHPVFGQSSLKVIAFAREHSPQSFIISTSLQSETNQSAMENGADFSVDKADLSEFFDEIKALH